MKPFNPVKLLLASLTLLCTVYNAYSQTPCGFDRQHRALLKNNSYYRKVVSENEQKIQNLLADEKFMRVQAPVYRIPVVVHVIHNGEPVGTGTNISDAQIQSAINSLTQYYRASLGSSVDAEIDFQLATLDPNCNPTTGIVRVDGSGVANYSTQGLTFYSEGGNELDVKNLSRWGSHYYNIWVVSEIAGNDGGNGVQGFAYFPGAPTVLDGTVILSSSFGYDPGGSLGYALKFNTNLNTTLVHELGHAFGVYHTFEGQGDANSDGIPDVCPLNTTCSSNGDLVCDTDPHIQSNSDCPLGTNACTGNPNANIVHNYMDYSSQWCMNQFSAGQVSRMRAFLVGARPELVSSLGLNAASPLTPYVPPEAAINTPTSLNLTDAFGILRVTLNQRVMTSDGSATDNGYLDRTNSCVNLIQLFRGVQYTFSATVVGFNDLQFGVWLDYNNDGDFLDAGELLAYTSHLPGTANPNQNRILSFNFTVPNTAPLNTPVRMRIIHDASNTSYGTPFINSETDVEAGQAEDYPLYFSLSLPVVLHSFSGQLAGNYSELQWTATLDQHSKGFDIERSYNGMDYTKIGYIPASDGTGTSSKKYTFTDADPAREKNYYRLKQWDVDNKFEYSSVVFIRSANQNGASFRILNNPFSSYIDIAFDRALKSKAEIRLMDITGQEVYHNTLSPASNQQIRIQLSGKSLKKGIYILEVRTNGERHTEKLIRY